MRKTLMTVALLALSMNSAHAFLSSITEKADPKGLTDMVGQVANPNTSPLADLLAKQLPVSGQQAAGGAGALLALAQNQLSDKNSTELQSLIPGMSKLNGAQSLLGNLQNLDMVKSAFSQLGIDPSMVSQFAPKILTYLGDKGASYSLINALSSLWKTAG